MTKSTEPYIIKLPFWAHLTAAEQSAVRRTAVIRRYEKGQLIYGTDSDCLGMIRMLSGSVRTFLVSEEGREITLFRSHQGEIDVLSASCVLRQITFETQMVAEESAELMIIGSSLMAKLREENIHVRCFLYELMAERFSTVMWAMQEVLFKRFDQRLAAFLIQEYERTGSEEIRMTHEQIAQNISSAREVVARMLKRFTGDGLVTLRRGVIRLADIPALRALNGEQ